MCTEQKVTVGDPERDGRRRRPRTMSKTITPRTFACGVNLVCENYRVRLKGVFIEQDSKVRIAGAHKKTAQRCAGRDHWLLEE